MYFKAAPAIFSSVLLCASSLWCASAARADTISYEVQGNASGTFDGTAFVDAAFTLIGVGDTAGSSAPDQDPIYNNLSSLTLSVSGFAAVSDANAAHFVTDNQSIAVGFEDVAPGGLVLDLQSFDLSLYDGVSNTGPTSVLNEYGPTVFHSASGDVSLTDTSYLVFSASVVPAVPVPPSVGLLASGLFGLLVISRYRRRQQPQLGGGQGHARVFPISACA